MRGWNNFWRLIPPWSLDFDPMKEDRDERRQKLRVFLDTPSPIPTTGPRLLRLERSAADDEISNAAAHIQQGQ
jgi:hypothetical protein